MTAARRTATAPSPIVPVPRDRPLALSFAQQRLWFVAQLDPRGSSLNAPFVLALQGELDTAALHRALREIVRRHDALRTTFADDGGVPVQRVTAEIDVALPLEDLTALAEDERAAAAAHLEQRESSTGFDLETGPVFRVRLVRMAANDHRLLFVAHHLVWDGWSFVVFARELGATYASLVGGGPAPALPPVVQYPDFAQWQRASLDDAALEHHRAYWLERLAGAPPTLDVPADRPRPIALSLRGGRVRQHLPEELSRGLRELARRVGVTPFMAMVAGFSALLCRYTGCEDLVIGTAIAGRTRRELESVLGMFVQTVPLRIDCAGDPSFVTLLGRVRSTCVEAFAHQDLPFDQLVEQLAPARDPSRMPLFQVVVGQHPAWPGFELPGLSVRADDAYHGSSMFDLSLAFQDTSTTVRATWEFSTALFDEATIRRMHAHWTELVSAALAEPDRPISQLPMLSDAERTTLLVDWNPATAPPPASCLSELFEAQVARAPDAAAMMFGDERLSYAELNARANRLARHLAARGVGREDRVGVCLGRSIDFVVSVVAAIKAGACYVPLDPSYPIERLAYMAADAGVRVVIARRGAGGEAAAIELSGLSGLSCATDIPGAPVWLDAAEPELSRLSDANLPAIATSRDLGYVMYTSGSTGRPKGTCIEQRSIARAVLGTDYVQLDAGDVVAHISNTSFDASTLEIWGALLNGATLHGIAPEVVISPEAFARALTDGGITAVVIATAVFHQLASACPAIFRSVDHVLIGGDALDAAVLRRVLAAGPPRRLINGYGPTEATTIATWHLVREVDDRAATIPIGRPIADAIIRILDRDRNLVPVGVRGEIYIGGPGVARGYWNRPELTAERFVADPFEPGGRLYRTGDLAAWRSDGTIEFHGRADHQVKLRGFRIELGEIEAQLMACAELAAATVVVRDDTGDPRLIAYVVPRVDAALDVEAVRTRLAAVLPRYMLPSAIIALDRLPMTPNGKVDRRALPAPPARHEVTTAPRTAMEEIVGEIWQRVLNHGPIGAQDSFFALGGHSLIAMQVVSRLRSVLGIAVPVQSLFEAPTLAAFAREVETRMTGGAVSSATALGLLGPPGPVQRPHVLPLSFAQQRLWFLDRLEPGGFSYNVAVFVRLTGPLRIDLVARSLGEIVRRHEVLRTRFVEAGGEPAQVIAPVSEVAHALEVGRIAADGGPAQSLEDWAVREARCPFSLADGPLVRAKLLALGPDHHVLGLAIHHIVCDAWSIGILMRELQELYRAGLAGTEPALPALPLQYADFAVRQRALSDEVVAEQLAYWTAQLADAPDRLELPTDRARPAVHTTRGALVHRRFTPAVSAAARELSKRSSVTLFMTLLAGYYALLQRYSGQSDLVVGTPITGRNHQELEDLIGFFVNTVALRVRIDGDTSFHGLLARVRDVCLRAHANQDVAFDRVVEAVRPARDASATPLFQVMFVLQNPAAPPDLPGLATDSLWVHPGAAKFDLTLYVEDVVEEIRTYWEYNTDLFDAATIERMAEHYGALVEAALARPDDRLGALPLLSEPERRMILDDWNRTQAAPSRQASVVELFEDQARRTPDAVAVVAGEVELGYRELAARAERWAAVLRARGCGPGVRVALALSRSPAFPVVVLAVLKAGAAYVPLDLAYPAERLAFMLRDCEARVVVTESAIAAGLPASGAEVVLIDASPEPPEQEMSGAIPGGSGRAPASDDLAYVIYTSGSTGRPKGVAMPHGAMLNLVTWQCARSPVPARTLQFAALSFDVSFQELFATWANGGCVVVAPEEVRHDPVELLRICRAQQIERLYLPFVALHQLAEASHGGDLGGLRLREIITAGEQLRITPAIAALFSQLPACRLYNQYGPTESHVVTEFALTGAPASWDALPSIGRPIANARIYVLDDELQPTPIGVAGELYIAGAGLACGYIGRAELTSARFVPDPFGSPGQRMYRTGDRAKYLASGDLVFLGRADDQVKVRGYRVEPGEIEAALGSHPAVSEAAVVARTEAGDTRLVAYIAWRDGLGASVAELKSHLRARLPEYMVPAVVVTLPALPLTPSGKLDRRALPKPEVERALHVAPRTAMEEVVANVWAPVLGVANLGTAENFFEAGGHSLLATQVVGRLGAALGVAIPVRTLFEAPTIAELALRLEAATGGARADLPVLEQASRARPLPLSYAQQRLWFIEQLDPGRFTYNVPLFLRLTGTLDVAALETSLHELVQRHEVLRTRFAEVQGEPRLSIAADLDVALVVEPVRERDVAERAQREALRPFDLGAGPLIRARLLRVCEDEHVLLLVMHHIVCDGWSLAILVRELGAAYLGVRTGTPPRLPELPVQYADFAHWQRRWLTGEVLDAQLAYWTRALAGAPPTLELPADRPRPAVRTARGAQLTRVLGGELTTALRALSRRQGATEFMTLLAAFSALLARYSGQHDIVVGSPIAGRNRAELEGLIGCFVNTLVLRVDTGGAPSFRELVERVREVCLGAYAHQDLPFDKLVEVLKPERELNRTPLFQVMFALQNVPTAELDMAGVTARPLGVHSGIAKFDLSVFVLDVPAGLAITWEYNTDRFDGSTIERMATHYASLVERLIGDPEQRPSAVPLLSAAERDQVLAYGAVHAELPRHESLHALFEAQVARTPDAAAVAFGDERLSYAELNARANRLARHLAARGVVRDDRVGVCLGRSIDFVVSVVAAIKAGACYVPLDPSYPVERLAYMAADAGVRVVIAQRGAEGEAGAIDLTNMAGAPIWLRAAGPALSQLSGANLPVTATGEDLAYVMYTSGSTGQPKGICIEQRSIARLVLGTDYVQLDAGDVVAHISNTSFDAATFEIWGALLNGATLHGIAPEVVMAPEELARTLADGGITAMFVTTALFHRLAAVCPAIFRSVDHVLFGGELLDAGAVRRVLAAGPPGRLLHVYGPTETTTFATWHLVREVDDRAATVPIGRPIANTTLRILDGHRNLVPVGVRGEIYIGGPGVARGYWNRPELTAERFVADPFEPGGRLYRTGDLAAWRSDGAIEFLGRADDQVKLRGFRIELGEIEAQLMACAELAAATVVMRDDTGDPRLIAYVVPRVDAALDVEAVRTRLATVLPRYMLPSDIVALDRLPMTPNGKVDRRALPAPSARRADLGGDYLAPEGDLERAISRIWAEVLGVDRIGANDNFFDLGGSSLMIISVKSQIEALLGRPVPVAVLFQYAQVRSLSAHLAGLRRETSVPPARPEDRTAGVRRLADQRRGRPVKP
ncbi:MAG TPA: amino acid adenylation domain-containing protein [Kofleriaceae bacterium]|nr:amino acid adenylation domain-containing protein [Kofleriaceae bacterium]